MEIHGQKISIEIADAPDERARGLMFRENLCEKCGMLFVFKEERISSFWMKNTLIPLDIIFIDKDGGIVNIFSAEPCAEEPCNIYTSTTKVKYALEVNKGFSLINNIKEGDAATFHLS